MKLQIGQTVYLKPINNRARRNKEIKTAIIKKVGRFFLLKFSTEMLIRMINGTLTHNDTQIYVVFS